MAVKIAILGGGTSTPRLCALLAAALPGPVALVLHGRRPERLAILADAAAARVERGRVSVRAEPDLDEALGGAEAVALLIRVGGFVARAHDEAFPRAFGRVGDEGLGLGGLANGWRTVPFVESLARSIQRACPTAFVANLMAPLGMTTAVLLDRGLDAVGVCELPGVTRAGLGHGPGEGHYGGLNHLGWFWDLPRRPGVHPLKYQARVFGDSPPAPGRAEVLRTLDAEVIQALRADSARVSEAEALRPTPWFEHALVPILAARVGGAPHHGFANVRNGGLVPALPPEQVVEVEATFEGAALRPRPSGPLPAEVRPLLDAVAQSEALGLAAARERSPALVRAAVGALPQPLPSPMLDAIVDRIIESVEGPTGGLA